MGGAPDADTLSKVMPAMRLKVLNGKMEHTAGDVIFKLTIYRRAGKLPESNRIGEAILEEFGQVAEVRLSAPNKHHFVYDFSAFDDVENHKEVFHADDRPYGLIQAAVSREDAPDAGPAWVTYRSWL